MELLIASFLASSVSLTWVAFWYAACAASFFSVKSATDFVVSSNNFWLRSRSAVFACLNALDAFMNSRTLRNKLLLATAFSRSTSTFCRWILSNRTLNSLTVSVIVVTPVCASSFLLATSTSNLCASEYLVISAYPLFAIFLTVSTSFAWSSFKLSSVVSTSTIPASPVLPVVTDLKRTPVAPDGELLFPVAPVAPLAPVVPLAPVDPVARSPMSSGLASISFKSSGDNFAIPVAPVGLCSTYSFNPWTPAGVPPSISCSL